MIRPWHSPRKSGAYIPEGHLMSHKKSLKISDASSRKVSPLRSCRWRTLSSLCYILSSCILRWRRSCWKIRRNAPRYCIWQQPGPEGNRYISKRDCRSATILKANRRENSKSGRSLPLIFKDRSILPNNSFIYNIISDYCCWASEKSLTTEFLSTLILTLLSISIRRVFSFISATVP